MIFGDFMRIYEFFTQWFTLGILFFVVDYNTEWLEVVTLGGLLAGSMLIALWTTLLDRLGADLAAGFGATREPRTLYYKKNTSPLPEIIHKAIVLIGVLFGVHLLSRYMPGYSMEITGPLISFLIAYGLVAVGIGSLLSVNLNKSSKDEK